MNKLWKVMTQNCVMQVVITSGSVKNEDFGTV